jgi:hypothetical protein
MITRLETKSLQLTGKRLFRDPYRYIPFNSSAA